jgi:DNA-binding transcriptional LysR family regulator
MITGEDVLRPILDAFMNEHQAVSARLYLLDRTVNLIDEGIDVALRIAHLADSNFVAVRVGEVRRVIAASPRYLAQHPAINEPADLAKQQIIAMTHFGLDSWSFPALEGSSVPRAVQFGPRLVVNTVRAAVASAVEGHGVTRLFSYHIAEEIREGRLQILLAKDEHEPLPAHLLIPHGRISVPKVRAFVDFAAPRLRKYFARLSSDASRNADAILPARGRMSAE